MADSSVLATSESILIDGANGVTSAPRAHFPLGGLWLGLAIVVAVAARWVKKPTLAVAFLIAGGLPGLVHVLVLRADAPLARGAMTASIGTTLGELQTRVPWPASQVVVVREDDDVLFPIGRYALPSRSSRAESRDAGVIELELRGGPLGSACRQDAQRVTCGAGL